MNDKEIENQLSIQPATREERNSAGTTYPSCDHGDDHDLWKSRRYLLERHTSRALKTNWTIGEPYLPCIFRGHGDVRDLM